jgi:hypothetical protein
MSRPPAKTVQLTAVGHRSAIDQWVARPNDEIPKDPTTPPGGDEGRHLELAQDSSQGSSLNPNRRNG